MKCANYKVLLILNYLLIFLHLDLFSSFSFIKFFTFFLLPPFHKRKKFHTSALCRYFKNDNFFFLEFLNFNRIFRLIFLKEKFIFIIHLFKILKLLLFFKFLFENFSPLFYKKKFEKSRKKYFFHSDCQEKSITFFTSFRSRVKRSFSKTVGKFSRPAKL